MFAQIKVETKGTNNPKESKTVLVPTVLNETSTLMNKESTPVSQSALNMVLNNQSSKAVNQPVVEALQSSQKNANKQPATEEGTVLPVSPAKDNEAIKSTHDSIKVIPYEGNKITVPFQQEVIFLNFSLLSDKLLFCKIHPLNISQLFK